MKGSPGGLEPARALTRRDWHTLVLGGLVAAPLAGWAARQKPDSRIAGVRVGVQTYSFRDRPLDRAIGDMAGIGLSYCELWSSHLEDPTSIPPTSERPGEIHRRWLRESSLEVPARVRERFDRAGVTLTAYNPQIKGNYSDEEIARVFEMARALRVNVVTVSSPMSVAPRLEPFAERFGITVAFHNHSRDRNGTGEATTPEDFDGLLRLHPRWIAANLDVGHFTGAGFDAMAVLERHHDRIPSLHLKDKTREGDRDVLWGEGDAPIAAVLRTLRDRRWDIPVQIEYEYRGQDTITEVARCYQYCRQALGVPGSAFRVLGSPFPVSGSQSSR